jgi:hypothetical protein
MEYKDSVGGFRVVIKWHRFIALLVFLPLPARFTQLLLSVGGFLAALVLNRFS